jgi:hypothetical protein
MGLVLAWRGSTSFGFELTPVSKRGSSQRWFEGKGSLFEPMEPLVALNFRQFTHNSPTTHLLCMDAAGRLRESPVGAKVRSNRADQVGAARLCRQLAGPVAHIARPSTRT